MRNCYLLTFVFCSTCLFAQQPFTCTGNIYLALAPSFSSTVYEVIIDPVSNEVVFDPLPAGGLGFRLNGIGYRSTDNFIYGLNQDDWTLYRIDATGAGEYLADLDLTNGFNYPTGDVTPDGKYLVLVGGTGFGGAGGTTTELAFIDLESPDYTLTKMGVGTNSGRVFDVAFDPTDGTLYGFDSNNHRLVTIDINTGQFNTNFVISNNADAMGAIFFDAFGNLFGYGSNGVNQGQTTFFSIDKETGEVTEETTGPTAQRNDGCSCPYTIKLRKTVQPTTAVPCAPVTYTFEIANSSGKVQTDITFEDFFPEDFVIQNISNTYSGTVLSGEGTNLILIENMTIPLGNNFIKVTGEFDQNTGGFFNNQATLSGLPEVLGLVAVSDNPFTLVENDSTGINVVPLDVDFSQVSTEICTNGQILLDPSIAGVDYLWNDGSTEATFTVTELGEYSVTVTSGCDEAVESITVVENEISVDLGEDFEVIMGDSLGLDIEYTGSPPFQFNWESGMTDLSCTTCETPFVQPVFEDTYSLSIVDQNGCTASDQVNISVFKDYDIFLPNVFSPNGDGFNEMFYAQTRRTQRINKMLIFNRWGGLVFERYNVFTNDHLVGWDGRFKGEKLNADTYVYFMEVELLDGEVLRVEGAVLLLK